MKKVVLLNDTSNWYHWGCTATSFAIQKRIRQLGFNLTVVPILATYQFRTIPPTLSHFDDRQFFLHATRENPEIFQILQSADIVVVNGEGTLHHVSKPCLSLLYLAYASKLHLNKQVHVINHSAYPGNSIGEITDLALSLYKHTYQHFDFVAIREHVSHQLMQQMGIQAKLSFDCLPLTVAEDYIPAAHPTGKSIVVAGSVSWPSDKAEELTQYMQTMANKGYTMQVLLGASAFPAQDDELFLKSLLAQGQSGWNIVRAQSLQQWLDCIGSACLLVSGRFHHTIAAASLSVPVVVMGSNTPKVLALTQSMETAPPLGFAIPNFLQSLVEHSHEAIEKGPVGQEIIASWRERAEHNFDGLKSFR